jgi:hypothetical protein
MDRLADDEGGHLFRQLTGVLDGDVDQDDDSESDSSYNPGDESGTEVDDEYEADEDDETGSNNSFGENQHDDVGDALYEGIKGLARFSFFGSFLICSWCRYGHFNVCDMSCNALHYCK